jgi:hypothetical protein
MLFLLCFVIEQNQGVRESDCRSFWLARNQRILDSLLSESSSIMCLQVPICLLYFVFSGGCVLNLLSLLSNSIYGGVIVL